MEYMKCGRVYHGRRDGDAGMAPTAILSRPIHILRLPARARGERGRGGRRGRPGAGGRRRSTESGVESRRDKTHSRQEAAEARHGFCRVPTARVQVRCMICSGSLVSADLRGKKTSPGGPVVTTGSNLIDPTCKNGTIGGMSEDCTRIYE